MSENSNDVKMNRYISSINKILNLLEEKLKYEEEPQKLIILKEMYSCARQEIKVNGKINTNLLGGVRIYLDSYSDYENNELLMEMDKLEIVLKENKM